VSSQRIELILCDVGGVLGSNGWDIGSRKLAAERFHLDFAPFEARHEEAVATFECGRMTLDEYLGFTVFNEDRSFSREEFYDFMKSQSVPKPATLELMRNLSAVGRWRMMTMNNESAELHEYRDGLFGLRTIFSAFLTSAYIAAQKPHGIFYDRALAIAHADPARTVFVDDRDENLAPALARGVHCIKATSDEAVRDGLAALGISDHE
jgi:putative hydrolase of the HAD superfamily